MDEELMKALHQDYLRNVDDVNDDLSELENLIKTSVSKDSKRMIELVNQIRRNFKRAIQACDSPEMQKIREEYYRNATTIIKPKKADR